MEEKSSRSGSFEVSYPAAFYDDYVTKLVEQKARWLAKQCGIPNEQEDIQQDMFVEILTAAKRYDSSKSGVHTFVDRVLSKFSADYKRRHYRAKDRNPEVELVDGETINDDERFSVTNTDPVEIITKQELRDEVNAIVQSLPKELQDICNALLNGSHRRKIARDLNISKNTFYRRLETLQKVFSNPENAKVSGFLKKSMGHFSENGRYTL